MGNILAQKLRAGPAVKTEASCEAGMGGPTAYMDTSRKEET